MYWENYLFVLFLVAVVVAVYLLIKRNALPSKEQDLVSPMLRKRDTAWLLDVDGELYQVTGKVINPGSNIINLRVMTEYGETMKRFYKGSLLFLSREHAMFGNTTPIIVTLGWIVNILCYELKDEKLEFSEEEIVEYRKQLNFAGSIMQQFDVRITELYNDNIKKQREIADLNSDIDNKALKLMRNAATLVTNKAPSDSLYTGKSKEVRT